MSRLGFTRKDASLLVINEVIPLFNQSTEVISPPINWSYFTPKNDRGPQLAESQEHQAGYQTQFRPHAPWRICSWIFVMGIPKIIDVFPPSLQRVPRSSYDFGASEPILLMQSQFFLQVHLANRSRNHRQATCLPVAKSQSEVRSDVLEHKR